MAGPNTQGTDMIEHHALAWGLFCLLGDLMHDYLEREGPGLALETGVAWIALAMVVTIWR